MCFGMLTRLLHHLDSVRYKKMLSKLTVVGLASFLRKSEVFTFNKRCSSHTFGTWNLRSLCKTGALGIVTSKIQNGSGKNTGSQVER